MCLYASNAAVHAAKKTRQKKGSVYAWKVLECERLNFRVLDLISPYFRKKWKPGINKSNRRKAGLTRQEQRELLRWRYISTDINCGIHVFLSKKDALQDGVCRCNSKAVVVKVKCDNADLVARNRRNSYTRQAVYMKVTLSTEEYDKALKG